jgi:hypothetical protein
MATMNVSSMSNAQSEQVRKTKNATAKQFRKRYQKFWANDKIRIQSEYQARYPKTRPICPQVFDYQFENLIRYSIEGEGDSWQVGSFFRSWITR